MKYFLICVGLLSLIYLNRTYSHFYYNIGFVNLQPTLNQKEYIIGKNHIGDQSLNYVALGDSLTSGVGSMSYNQTFPYIFAQNLNQKENKTIKLLVLSQPGAKTDNLIKDQLTDPRLEDADYITLLIGINDIHDLRSVESFSKNFDSIISILAKQKAKIIVLNLPYLGPQQSILFPYQFLFDYQTRRYNAVIAKDVQKYNLILVDLYSMTKDYSQTPDFYSLDYFHPSPKGYQFWGEIINP